MWNIWSGYGGKRNLSDCATQLPTDPFRIFLVLKSVKRQFGTTQSFLSPDFKALKLRNFLSGSSFCFCKTRQVLNLRSWQYLSFGSRFRGSIDTAASLLRLLSRPKQNTRLWLWLQDIRKKAKADESRPRRLRFWRKLNYKMAYLWKKKQYNQ